MHSTDVQLNVKCSLKRLFVVWSEQQKKNKLCGINQQVKGKMQHRYTLKMERLRALHCLFLQALCVSIHEREWMSTNDRTKQTHSDTNCWVILTHVHINVKKATRKLMRMREGSTQEFLLNSFLLAYSFGNYWFQNRAQHEIACRKLQKVREN